MITYQISPEMRNQLKKLLTYALRELNGEHEDVVVESVQLFSSILLCTEELFEDIPERLYGWNHGGHEFMPFIKGERPENEQDLQAEFFPRQAILLIDGLHGAAHGHTRYMYRAKGDRLYLFEDGEIAPVNIAASVDENGFFLMNEYVGDLAFNPDSPRKLHHEDARMPFEFLLNNPNDQYTPRFIVQDLIKILSNIRRPFKRVYLLEHLLVPPDVDTISDFSMNVRKELWDTCLSSEFEEEIGPENQQKCMKILSAAEISASPHQIVEFVRQLSRNKKEFDEIFKRLDQFESSLITTVEKISLDLTDARFWEQLFRQLDLEETSRFSTATQLIDLDKVEDVVLDIVVQFTKLVEKNGLWKELWNEDKARHESSAQNLFFLMAHSYCKSRNIDLTPEANSGNGPVDFKMSHGYNAKVVVEIKLSTNTSLVDGYKKQLETYKVAEDTDRGIFLVIDVGELGKKLEKVTEMHNDAISRGERASQIKYVDGRRQKSASKR